MDALRQTRPVRRGRGRRAVPLVRERWMFRSSTRRSCSPARERALDDTGVRRRADRGADAVLRAPGRGRPAAGGAAGDGPVGPALPTMTMPIGPAASLPWASCWGACVPGGAGACGSGCAAACRVTPATRFAEAGEAVHHSAARRGDGGCRATPPADPRDYGRAHHARLGPGCAADASPAKACGISRRHSTLTMPRAGCWTPRATWSTWSGRWCCWTRDAASTTSPRLVAGRAQARRSTAALCLQSLARKGFRPSDAGRCRRHHAHSAALRRLPARAETRYGTGLSAGRGRALLAQRRSLGPDVLRRRHRRPAQRRHPWGPPPLGPERCGQGRSGGLA